MQLHQFKCSRCSKTFIAANPEDGRPISCVQCGSLKMHKIATPFATVESLEDESGPNEGSEREKSE